MEGRARPVALPPLPSLIQSNPLLTVMRTSTLATEEEIEVKPYAHPDPITGEPGSHPIGTGVGALGGAAAGAIIGTAGGPLGTAIGGGIGAIIGGLAGHEVAESFDPTPEDAYWEENFHSQPYVVPGMTYDDYRPAYRAGFEAFRRSHGEPYEEIEIELRKDWELQKGESRLTWDQARDAVHAGWLRATEVLPPTVNEPGTYIYPPVP